MKNLVLFVCVLIFASSNSTELKAQVRNAIRTFEDDKKACLIENNLTTADLYQGRDIINNSYAEPENEEKTKKMGCWVACVLKKQNLMEGSNIKEGQIHEKLNEVIDQDSPRKGLVHKMARKCMKEGIYKIQEKEEPEIQETEGEAETEQT